MMSLMSLLSLSQFEDSDHCFFVVKIIISQIVKNGKIDKKILNNVEMAILALDKYDYVLGV